MNCQTFEQIVNDLAGQQMMEASLREPALAHTGECEVCARRLEDERALTLGLRALATEMEMEMEVEMEEAEAPARIEEELLAAFRKHRFSRPRWSAIHDWRYWATTAAAVLLIVLGIVAMRARPTPLAVHNPQNPPSPPGMNSLVRQQAGETAVTEKTIGPMKPAEQSKPKPTLANRNPKRSGSSQVAQVRPAIRSESSNALSTAATTLTADDVENEVATDFLPVGYASPTSLQDGGQIMRVELPRSALARFGFPVNMARANERVKADVLVGTDGQARAIRFVQ